MSQVWALPAERAMFPPEWVRDGEDDDADGGGGLSAERRSRMMMMIINNNNLAAVEESAIGDIMGNSSSSSDINDDAQIITRVRKPTRPSRAVAGRMEDERVRLADETAARGAVASSRPPSRCAAARCQ